MSRYITRAIAVSAETIEDLNREIDRVVDAHQNVDGSEPLDVKLSVASCTNDYLREPQVVFSAVIILGGHSE